MDITDYSALGQIAVAFAAGYISIVSGSSLDHLKAQREVSLLRTVLTNSVTFIVGFSITFVVLGASATWLGQLLVSWRQLLDKIAGLILIVFGVHVLGIVRINALYRDKRFHNVEKPRGVTGALVLGLAFAFGWTPCLGPILAGILAIASTKQTVTEGMMLLAVYSAGLGIPFLMTSLALNKFLSFYSRFKKHFHAVEMASGALVIAVGVMMVTGSLTRLASWFSFLNRFAL